ncbi:paraquat-inducible protein A [Agrobacterium sp. ES01]|uniref:paraquat-inducible protein A n=1 Tax=Agrobacterium sp. ES01 TaxID=3420714 RepID=UPI003D0F2617
MIWVRAALLASAGFCLALGLSLPLLRFETLYFFSDAPSLAGIIASLWQEGDAFLAFLVGLFSVVLPIFKLVALTAEAIAPAADRGGDGLLGRLVPHLTRWSMMDVMLVAIVIFAAKTSGLASAFTQPGLWFYAGSSLIAGLLQAMMRKPRQ